MLGTSAPYYIITIGPTKVTNYLYYISTTCVWFHVFGSHDIMWTWWWELNIMMVYYKATCVTQIQFWNLKMYSVLMVSLGATVKVPALALYPFQYRHRVTQTHHHQPNGRYISTGSVILTLHNCFLCSHAMHSGSNAFRETRHHAGHSTFAFSWGLGYYLGKSGAHSTTHHFWKLLYKLFN